MRTRLALAALAAALALGGSPARAGLIPYVDVSAAAGGNYAWDYNVVVTSDLVVSKGDFFTIYDFASATGTSGVTAPAGWKVTSQLTGVTPPYTAPVDRPDVPNYTFTYTGDAPIKGRTSLGDFVLLSPYAAKGTAFFTSLVSRVDVSDPADPKERTVTRTTVAVPDAPPPGGGTPPAAPEPATIALLAAGVPCLAAARAWKRRRA